MVPSSSRKRASGYSEHANGFKTVYKEGDGEEQGRVGVEVRLGPSKAIEAITLTLGLSLGLAPRVFASR